MSESLLSFAVLLPLVLAIAALLSFWRTLSRRLLFLLASSLSLVGLQALVAPISVGVFFTGMSGISAAAANDAFVLSTLFAGAVQVAVGLPFIWWLSYAFRRPQPGSQPDAAR